MQLQMIELRQDRNLIKANFDGYKLSLDSVPVIKEELGVAPFRAKPSEEQFSYLHVELFSLHNHLVKDPWDTAVSYFVDEIGNILKCAYDKNCGRPRSRITVYKVPGLNSRQSGDYNISFRFVSEKFCVLCDGCNKLFLFETGDRQKCNEWKNIFTANISDEKRGFIIGDCRLDIINEEKFINCAFQRIENENGNFFTYLQLGVFIQLAKVKTWSFELRDSLSGKGSINYLAFEPKAKSLVLASNKEFKFKSDVQIEKIKESKPSYLWTQSDDDITIKFDSREEDSYNVTCSKDSILVKCGNEVLLDANLFGKIESDLTTWTVENNFLQVILIKGTPSLHWPFLVENRPAEAIETSTISTTVLDAQPVSNLEAQIEECDFPINSLDEDHFIVRFDLNSKLITHKVILGNNPPIFSTCLRAGYPNAIVTRQDVDACLWLQFSKPNGEWSLRHEGNLHAFGYVQASKQQKKFIDCSPGMDYAIISESFRHVFIYKSTYDTENSLRNRNGPQISLGKQHLVALDDVGEVLGMSIDNEFTTLLTEKCILFLQINC